MHTRTSLKHDLQSLGVHQGMVLIVHASLKSMGDVCGGPVAVILALEDLLGDSGTLVMPTHSTDLTDPAGWCSPPAPEGCIQLIRDEMPPYDRYLTPTRQMGFLSETFRKQKGVIRSDHPHVSFAAWGRHAEEICGTHPLDYSLGETSPLGRIYDRGGHVLLIGVDHSKNTSIHLAEHRHFNGSGTIIQKAPMLVDGERKWVDFKDLDVNDDDFAEIGNDFDNQSGLVRCGVIGDASSRLVPQAPLVDFAQLWMANKAI